MLRVKYRAHGEHRTHYEFCKLAKSTLESRFNTAARIYADVEAVHTPLNAFDFHVSSHEAGFSHGPEDSKNKILSKQETKEAREMLTKLWDQFSAPSFECKLPRRKRKTFFSKLFKKEASV
ncbi:MAG: hypothetical protein ACLFVE_15105 [Chitinispirillaceae bacterium]